MEVFATLETVCEKSLTALRGAPDSPYGDGARRLVASMTRIRDHGRALEPVARGFVAVYHHYDLDEDTPGNGYRTLVKVVQCCILHIIQKGRYITSSCQGAFFRAEHNASEIESYCDALCQLRALLYLAQRLLHDNPNGELYSLQDNGELSQRFVREYTTMHKACFYGRCLGFQFSPSLRPFLQTVVISMVSYGETFGKQQSGLGMAALSFLTSGKYVMDPELRGLEFERITQNLDMQFWKAFWNLTESELLSGFSRIASIPVQVNLTLSLPPVPLHLPLATDPSFPTLVAPPLAHWGPGPVHLRLISYDLREGQDSEELLAFSRTEAAPVSLSMIHRPQRLPPSPWLLVHFHGGGFVAQTSRSHENYLRNWSKTLKVPILSVDYSLSPEAPFPRALEECFYAYCWALQNCHLLGSTAQRVVLAGDSAGGNLCITVSMKAIATGVRVPDGIMAAYPATLLTTDASPSRLLTSIDPLLPLGVLSKCLNAYAGADPGTLQPSTAVSNTLSTLSRDAVLLLSDLTVGASSWIQSLLDPARRPPLAAETCPTPPCAASDDPEDFPENFKPLRSECQVVMQQTTCPVVRNPFVSPLLAPESLLRGLPPLHIVASALDALLDDSVMFARRLRAMGQPVGLTVVEDLPHGFLSLSQLTKETEAAADLCVEKIREVFQWQTPPPSLRRRPKSERTNGGNA